MRTIKFLLQKEFRQIFRNRAIVAMIFAVPVIQLLILPLAANYEVKNINLSVVDNDRTPVSNKLVNTITASGYFRLAGYQNSFADAFRLIESDKADLVLEIPNGFEQNLFKENGQTLFVAVNAINGSKAGLGSAYLGNIIRNYNQDLNIELHSSQAGTQQRQSIAVIINNRFNPHMNYHLFMVPGILAVLLTMVGGFLSALNIVKEKEAGTIEQINVTPIKKHHFILGKLIPFWLLGFVIFSLGLLVATLVYGIVPQGSLLLLYGFIAVYLLAVLGLGLLISTFCDTQQQAMIIAFFFVMIFILLGGLFTSIDSMPVWAQWITKINPVSYMIDVMRMVILKGSGFAQIKNHLFSILVIAIILNSWAILNYRKNS